MQGGHGYNAGGAYGSAGGYGYDTGAYGYNAGGAYGSAGGYGYDAGAYGSAGGYGYDTGAYGYNAGAYGSAGGYGSASAGGSSYYSSLYPPAPGYEEAGRRAHDFPAPPLDGVELKASEACPKNYVIFDQTSTSSWVTFHPSLAHRLSGASSAAAPVYGVGGDDAGKDASNEGCSPVRHKEDSAEIDALLMSSEEEDDDVVSTGRAPGGGGGSSPDSTCSSTGRPRKKERIKKMMRKLKGILPGGGGGGGQMDAPAVLDEAVWYLKSLNVQANKRGGGG